MSLQTGSTHVRLHPGDTVVTAIRPLGEVGRAIYEHPLRVASGERAKSERQGLGDHEFAPREIGAAMRAGRPPGGSTGRTRSVAT